MDDHSPGDYIGAVENLKTAGPKRRKFISDQCNNDNNNNNNNNNQVNQILTPL